MVIRLTVLMALLMLLSPGARAQEATEALMKRAGFEKVEAAFPEVDVAELKTVAGRILAGEAIIDGEAIGRALQRLGVSVKDGLLSALKALIAPVLATILLRMTLGRRDGALTLLCRLCCACALAGPCAAALKAAGEAMSSAARMADVLSPVLSAMLAMTGSVSAAAVLSPVSALCADIIENALAGAGLTLCAVAAVVNVAGSLSGHFRMDRLFALIKQLTVWGVGLLMAAYAGLLALEGRMASAQDATSLRAVRTAIKSAIPFVGGDLSDSAGALLQSAAVARSTIGVAGMALVAVTCAGPIVRLFVHMLSLKLASAAIEPVADPGIVRVTAGFGDVAGMLLATCAGGAMLVALLCGACLCFFGG